MLWTQDSHVTAQEFDKRFQTRKDDMILLHEVICVKESEGFETLIVTYLRPNH